jgi:predicted SAM-dependent methyltransferase
MPRAFSPLVELDVEFPLSRALFAELGVRGLHCGCGTSLHPAWLNSDWRALHDGDRDLGPRTFPERLYRVEENSYFIQHAVPEPFPIEPESLEWAFSEDFLEHLRPEDGIAWLAEMRRLLVPGGLVRIGVPDLQKYLAGYADPADRFLAEHARGLESHFPDPTPLERPAFIVNKIFYGWGHKWMYDFDEVCHAALAAGFRSEAITRRAFRDGAVPEVAELDLSEHSLENLHVEIVKS